MTVFHSLEHWHFSYCYLYSIYIVYIFSYCLQLFFVEIKKSINFRLNILIRINCWWFKFSIWFKYTSVIFPKIRFKLNIFLKSLAEFNAVNFWNAKCVPKTNYPFLILSCIKLLILLFHCFSRKYRARASIQI